MNSIRWHKCLHGKHMKLAVHLNRYTFAINMLTPLPVEQRAQGELFTLYGNE